eukprot:jgi/Chlat1/168/Chrsp1S08791
MGSWLQSQIRRAEELLESVDRTAKNVTAVREREHTTRTPEVAFNPEPIPEPEIVIEARSPLPSAQRSLRAKPLVKSPAPRIKSIARPVGAVRAGIAPSADTNNSGPAVPPPAEAPSAAPAELIDSLPTQIVASPVVSTPPPSHSPAGSISKQEGSTLGSAPTTSETISARELAPAAGAAKGVDNAEVVTSTGVESNTGAASALQAQAAALSNGHAVVADAGDDNADIDADLKPSSGTGSKVAAGNNNKEARLARVAERLSERLAEYKAENAQLEELVRTSEARAKEHEALIAHLQQELVAAQSSICKTLGQGSVAAAEVQTSAALATKNQEVLELSNRLESVVRQLSIVEGRSAALASENDMLMQGRDQAAAEVLQSVRHELAMIERQLDEERAAHSALRQNSSMRESELEARLADSSTALVDMQRQLNDRAAKAQALEQRLSAMEVECASANQRLAALQAETQGQQPSSSGNDAASFMIASWKDEARQQQAREAEAALARSQAELAQMQVELQKSRQRADDAYNSTNTDLERRFRELTELLYVKQTQLEAMASDRAAMQLQVEHEKRRAQDAVERERTARMRAVTVDVEDNLAPIDAIGSAYEQLHNVKSVGPSIQRAARFLDFSAVTCGRFLWRNPMARIGFVLYLLCVHLFLMLLLHRMQATLDHLAAAKSSHTFG